MKTDIHEHVHAHKIYNKRKQELKLDLNITFQGMCSHCTIYKYEKVCFRKVRIMLYQVRPNGLVVRY